MNNLKNLRTFDDFKEYYSLNESLGDNGQTAINRAFLNMGDIPLSNGEVIKPRDIVKVVNDAIIWIATEFRTYYSFAKDCNIIYLINDPDCDTMAVDEHMNMYMDVLFIYHNLKMDKYWVAAIIMHEILHVVYNHIERGKNWLAANGKPITDFKDTNLAGDVEVNTTLVNKGVVTEEVLVKDLKGLFLSKKNLDRTNMPMEYILENEKLMEKLRGLASPPPTNNGQEQGEKKKEDTTPEWDNGYKDGWDKIAELLKKYGAKKLVEVLQENGIILNNGMFNHASTQEDIDMLKFIQIKSLDEFLNESKSKKNDDGGQTEGMFKTYDQGYIDGVKKAIEQIVASVSENPESAMSGLPQGGGVEPNTKLTGNDLQELNLPDNPNAPKQAQGSSSFPQNVKTKPTTADKDLRVGDMGGAGNVEQGEPQEGDQSGQGGQDNSGKQNSDQQSGGGKSGQKSGDQKNEDGKSGQGGSDDKSGKDGDSNDQKGDGKSGQGGSDDKSQSNDQSGKQNGDSSQSEQSGQKSAGRGSGKGVDSSQSDAQKLANDLKNKSQGGRPSYANKPNKSKSSQSDNAVGNTGSLISEDGSSFAKRALKNSGYSDEDIQKIVNDVVEKNKRLNSPEGVEEKRQRLYSKLPQNDPVKKYLDEIEVSAEKYKNIWKKIMRQFLGINNRKAGNDKMSRSVDWKSKRHIARGRLGVRHLTEAQEPQNINVYVDVSGSVNVEMLEVICKSLSIFCEQYRYSGINIIPWASSSNGVHEVKSLKKSSPEQVTKEILGYISEGIQECGGGTDLKGAMLPELVSIYEDKTRTKKDDKHIIITDGETMGDESKIESLIEKHTSARVVRNCFWMIYDARQNVRSSWESSIQGGTLLFLDSKVVIGNK